MARTGLRERHDPQAPRVVGINGRVRKGTRRHPGPSAMCGHLLSMGALQSGHSAWVEPTDVLSPDLDDVERQMLRWGVIEWGGPARCTDELAIAMGFDN